MNNTPLGNRIYIAFFGRRNSGKSTLVNALTNQEVSVVSPVAGTTTDPVFKAMELLPIGPVAIIDTAGLDDEGDLGELRIKKTLEVMRKTNLAVVVLDAAQEIYNFEKSLVQQLKGQGIATIGVLNKCDVKALSQEKLKAIQDLLDIPLIEASALEKKGIEELKKLIIENVPDDEPQLGLLGDIINTGDVAILVTPIDTGAPKGRMILPQQQTIRDIIDNNAIAMVTREDQLKETINMLVKKPAIVITDSQAFKKVAEETPLDITLTSFSILYARYKGELDEMVRGLRKIKELKPGSKVLIVEGCTHHRQADDIGKVKIPRWISQMAGGELVFEWASGTHFPKDLTDYHAIIHCGGCMLNRKEMKYRVKHAKECGVAMTNYGILIAYIQGILERALKPFPEAAMELEGL